MISVAYGALRSHFKTDHDQKTKILFYQIQSKTSALLSSLLHQFSLQRDDHLHVHEEVMGYIKALDKQPLSIDLSDIHARINEGLSERPYDIYISDKDLIIKNTTYDNDLGYDLNFAIDAFEKHHEKGVTGISVPIYEPVSGNFFSYSDSYLVNKGEKQGVLQISYTYKEDQDKLLSIKRLIEAHDEILDIKTFLVTEFDVVTYIDLQEQQSVKEHISETLYNKLEAKAIGSRLTDKELYIERFYEEGGSYTSIYLSVQSSIVKDTKVVYSLLLDTSPLDAKLRDLNVVLFMVALLGVVAIILSTRLRKKEIKLTLQDKFVQSAMHEIRTPLSIITLNNELRELEFGKDEYSKEIDAALKTLENSYEDMSFIATNQELEYSQELLSLSDCLQARISYFESMINVNQKHVDVSVDSSCLVKMSLVELTRLIDNSLSNAIKYSEVNGTIHVCLKENILSFHNGGQPISDTKKIFHRYFRENSVVGGYGLGLSIIKNIIDKYQIKMSVTSSRQKGTMFTYVFKCHLDDISSM